MKQAQKFLIVLASACLLMSAIAGLSHISAQQSNFPPGGSYAIANTTFTVSNATFSANTCTKLDSTVGSSTVTMTGMASGSVISIAPAADTATIVGFGTAGGLVIDAWPTSNTANIKVCNQTASGITTGATLTFNISAR